MSKEEIQKEGVCLNCGSNQIGNYCQTCGQKVYSTKISLKIFLADAFESIFSLDNKLFKTLKDLFIYPGKVTSKYISGERIRYVYPVKLYIWISVLYFLIVTVIDTNRFFLININNLDGRESEFVDYLQYSMFLLLPVFGGIIKLVNWRKKKFYLEHLIFGLHLHVVWYSLSIFYAGSEYFLNNYEDVVWITFSTDLIQTLSKVGVLVYLFFFQKRVYDDSWLISFFKTWVIIVLYASVLLAVSILYTSWI